MESKSLSKFLLQASVVALGFGMNLHEVLRAGRSGFVYTALSITGAMLLGMGLGYLIHVQKKPSFLISAGTAICGGSAIAAVGPIAEANEEEMAVSLGTVFILNSVALFLFPIIGYALHMSQNQFGLWSALAIHDTSSVVGATAKYGAAALAVGTTIKLARALWIVPLAAATAIFLKSKARIQWPWFILFFCFAALLNTLLPAYSGAFRRAESPGQNRPDGNALPDRHRPEQADARQGGRSPAAARPDPVAHRGQYHPGANSWDLDSPLSRRKATAGGNGRRRRRSAIAVCKCPTLEFTFPIQRLPCSANASKAGAGGGFVFVGGDGFDEARDRERVADAALAADEVQPAALAGEGDGKLYDCGNSRAVDLRNFVQVHDHFARALGHQLMHEGAQMLAGIADGQPSQHVHVVDAVGCAGRDFQWWMQSHRNVPLVPGLQSYRVAARHPGAGGLCIIR